MLAIRGWPIDRPGAKNWLVAHEPAAAQPIAPVSGVDAAVSGPAATNSP
jgi:hypothetical protein